MATLSALQLPLLAQPELVVPQLELPAPMAAPEGPTIPERKHCGGCGNVKGSEDFHKSRSRGDGLQVGLLCACDEHAKASCSC